jgi:hypothetical protein
MGKFRSGKFFLLGNVCTVVKVLDNLGFRLSVEQKVSAWQFVALRRKSSAKS